MKLNFRLFGILTLLAVLVFGTPAVDAQSTTSWTGTSSFLFFFWADPPEVGVTSPASTVTLRWYVGTSDQISCTPSGFSATITPNSSFAQGSAVVTPPRDTSATYRITCTDSLGTYSRSITMKQNPNFYQQIVPTPDYSTAPIYLDSITGLNIPNFGVSLISAVQATGPQIHSKTREGIIYGQANGSGPAWTVSYTMPDLGSCEGDAVAAGLSQDSTYYCLEDKAINPPSSPVCYMFCTGGQTGGGPAPSWSGGSINGTYKVTRYFYETEPQVIPWAYPQDPAFSSATCSPSSGSTACNVFRHLSQVTPPPSTTPTVTLVANPITVASGNAASLTWSSTNAVACTGTGFDTAGATSGTVTTGALTTTTNFSISCTGTGGTGTGATWQYKDSDISDFTCPITADINTLAYSGVSNCPASPQGKSCSGSPSVCKINSISGTGGGSGLGCNIDTEIYNCVGGSVAPAPTATASAVVAVTSAADLIGSTGPAVSSAVNQPITLAGSVTNSGTTAVGTFPNIVQVCNDPDCTTINTNGSLSGNSIASLAAGATQTVSASYTPTSLTPLMYRVCANVNGSFTNIVTESNYANNCGQWKVFTVTSGGGSVTSCSASPSTVTAGGSTTWTALPAGIASYTFTPSETGTGVTRTTNTYARTYATPGTYGMSVTAGGATVACTNNVTVGTPSCGTATPTITATPDRVTTGSTSVLTVQASGVDGTCTVTGPGVNQTLTASSCGIPSTNITTPALTGQSTYTVSCDSGEATAKSVINVSTKWTIF